MPINEDELQKLMRTLNSDSTNTFDGTVSVVPTPKPKAKVKPKTKTKSKWTDAPSWFHLSKFGQQVADELDVFIGSSTPVMLIGGTGLGKTVVTDMVSRKHGRGSVGFNCYSGMDIASLVGLWRPNTDGTIEWEHGLLTRAIIEGYSVRIEEFTRATAELKSKCFGILDSKDRYWALPEAGIDSVPVHPDFTIIASANPAGGGYVGTMREDKASMSRFGGVITINEPLADEHKAMLDVTKDKDIADRILRFAEILRKDPLTYISTRDMYYLARALNQGIDPKRAVELTVAPKFEGMESNIITHGRAVFEELGKKLNMKQSVADAIKESKVVA